MRAVTTGAISLILSIGLLGGCADEESATDPAGPAPGSSTGPTTATSGPTSSEELPEDPVVPDPSADGVRTELRGTITPGVEPGCHLLRSGATTYQLIWSAGTLVDGQQVQVVGDAQPDLVTTCQEGIPFVVERLMSAGTD